MNSDNFEYVDVCVEEIAELSSGLAVSIELIERLCEMYKEDKVLCKLLKTISSTLSSDCCVPLALLSSKLMESDEQADTEVKVSKPKYKRSTTGKKPKRTYKKKVVDNDDKFMQVDCDDDPAAKSDKSAKDEMKAIFEEFSN